MKKHEEEILRLVQSGLPPDQLRAEMTRRLVQGAEAEEPEWGALLRAAAIPRRLDEGVVGVLRGAPNDEAGNQAALQRLADFPFVLPDPEGRSYALHEEVRAVLLEDWQAPERRTRYVELSRALWEYFARGGLAIRRRPDDTSGGSEETGKFVPFPHSLLESLYHRFAFDPAGAFAEFEQRTWNATNFYRRAECGALLAAADEQERELDKGQRLWMRYYRARLALVLDRWAEAEAGYRELLADISPLPVEGEGLGVRVKLRTWTLNDLGMALHRQGKWAKAVEVYQEALKGKHELGDRHGEGATLNNLGLFYQAQGRWEQAIEYYEASLRIKRELGDRHGEGQTLGNLGSVYYSQGRREQAIECHQESLRICRELGDRYGECNSLMGLGNVYQAQGRWEQAIECYQQIRDIFHVLGDRHGEGLTLGNLGELYTKCGSWTEAKENLEQSLSILQELGDPQNAAEALHYLGEWHKGQGQHDEAIARYEEALAIRREMAAWPQAGETLHALAEVYVLRGDWAKAAEIAEQAAEAWRRAAEGHG